MKAIQLKAFGFKNLALSEMKTPEPQPHEVLIKIEAASLNYLDKALVGGTYNPNITLPRIPLSDGAGVVAKVGSQVTKWKVGDRVMVHFYQKWLAGKKTAINAQSQAGQATQGVLAEFACFPEESLVRIPSYLTSEEAATLPIAGLTAWTGLFEHGKLKAGDVVVTQGTGGVSIFALQLAKAAGAKVIATSSSDQKLEQLRKLGADEVIHYKKNPNWHEEVQKLTSGEGADMTLDIAGATTISNSIYSVKRHGFVGLVGFIGGHILPIDFFRTIQYNIRIQGFSVGNRENFEDLTKMLEVSKIKPVIDQVFDMEDTVEAFQYFNNGNFVGKVVIKL